MDAHNIPDIEMFIFFKWALAIGIMSAIGTFASLIVKRWWYGSNSHNRRADDNVDTRGVLERFFEMREEANKAAVEMNLQLGQILQHMQGQTKQIREAVEVWKCRFEPFHGRK